MTLREKLLENINVCLKANKIRYNCEYKWNKVIISVLFCVTINIIMIFYMHTKKLKFKNHYPRFHVTNY